MADLSKKKGSKTKDSITTPLLSQHVKKEQKSSAKNESLEACRDVVRTIASAIEDDQESGLGSESPLEASLDSVESHLSSGRFQKEFLTSLDSTGSSDLQKDEDQLQTQVIPPPLQPLSKQDDIIKGFSNADLEGLEESVEAEQESYGFVPAGTSEEPPLPPGEAGTPNEGGKKPDPPEEEIQREVPQRLRPVRVRTVPQVEDRAFKYIIISFLCVTACMACLIAGVVFHMEKLQEWTFITAGVTALVGGIGAVIFCIKAVGQAEKDEIEMLAQGEFIRYEVVTDTAVDPTVSSGGPPVDQIGRVDGLG